MYTKASKKLIKYFQKQKGIASYPDIIKAGFHKSTITKLIQTGEIEKISRSLYKITEGMEVSNPDLLIASIKIPKGVICLISALFFHEATNEIPQYIEIAIPRNTHETKLDYPPVRFYRISEKMWKVGIETHIIEGHKIKVYSLAKTIADCFKFRNKIGSNIARESLKIALKEKNISPKEIIYFSKICRVEKIVKPILESLL